MSLRAAEADREQRAGGQPETEFRPAEGRGDGLGTIVHECPSECSVSVLCVEPLVTTVPTAQTSELPRAKTPVSVSITLPGPVTLGLGTMLYRVQLTVVAARRVGAWHDRPARSGEGGSD
jgi:hypothetical protein